MVSTVGGLLCLDRLLLQIMISRPIVSGPLIGCLFNEITSGLVIGAFIELLWIDRIPVGTYVPPNDSITTITAVAAAASAGKVIGNMSNELSTLSILLCVPLGIAAQKIDAFIFENNRKPSTDAELSAATGSAHGIEKAHLKAISRYFIITVIQIVVYFLSVSLVLIWIYPLLSTLLLKALTITYFLLPVIGVAVALNTINHLKTIQVFSALFLTFTLILQLIYGN
jgi:mannose PTS system EIIC component